MYDFGHKKRIISDDFHHLKIRYKRQRIELPDLLRAMCLVGFGRSLRWGRPNTGVLLQSTRRALPVSATARTARRSGMSLIAAFEAA